MLTEDVSAGTSKIAPWKIAPIPDLNPKPNPNPGGKFVGGNIPGAIFMIKVLFLRRIKLLNNVNKKKKHLRKFDARSHVTQELLVIGV